MINLNITEEHLEKMYEEVGHGRINHIILIEEMSELTKVLTKLERTYPARMACDRDNLVEEMAHVYVCLEAVRRLEGVTYEDLQNEINKKEGVKE